MRFQYNLSAIQLKTTLVNCNDAGEYYNALNTAHLTIIWFVSTCVFI